MLPVFEHFAFRVCRVKQLQLLRCRDWQELLTINVVVKMRDIKGRDDIKCC